MALRSRIASRERAIGRRRFQAAHDGRADRDDSPAPGASARDRIDGRLRHVEPLRMQRVTGKIVVAQRLERAGPDVQRHVGGLDAELGERGEHCRVKVQTCGRRRHRTRLAGEYRLVAIAGESVVAAAEQHFHRALLQALSDRLSPTPSGFERDDIGENAIARRLELGRKPKREFIVARRRLADEDERAILGRTVRRHERRTLVDNRRLPKRGCRID